MEENNQNNDMPVQAKINPLGIASLVLALIGLLVAGIPCGIAAVVTGIMAIVKFVKEKEKTSVVTVVLAAIGLIIGLADVILVAIALPTIVANIK